MPTKPATAARKTRSAAAATKTTASKTAKRGPVGPSTAADTIKALVEGAEVPTHALGRLLDLLKLPDIAATVVAARKRDLEAIVEANRRSYEGLADVVQGQSEALKAAIAEFSLAAKLAVEDPREGVAQLDQIALALFRMSVGHLRQLADAAAKSQADAFESITARIRANVDEVNALLGRAGAAAGA